MRISVSFQIIFRPVGRLGLWLGSGRYFVSRLGSGPRVVGRLGSGVWVSGSFQIFAFCGGEWKCPRWGGKSSGRRNMSEGKMSRLKVSYTRVFEQRCSWVVRASLAACTCCERRHPHLRIGVLAWALCILLFDALSVWTDNCVSTSVRHTLVICGNGVTYLQFRGNYSATSN